MEAKDCNSKHVFFNQTSIPDSFDECCIEIDKFINQHSTDGRKIVLITSGGTTVPLESRTVRFIDNFSSGTRGSASAEYFLSHDYAVIFLHRHKSLEPFSRHINRQHFIDILQLTPENEIMEFLFSVKDEHKEKLSVVLKQFQSIEKENLLLKLEFTSLGDYLHILKAACEKLNTVGDKAMLYLAAAVSDFYIPKADMSEHKIQSSNGPLELKLQLVPKMLEPLVKDWVPSAFIISFKLETDKDILISKSRQALDKYKHQLVIANELEKRKREVTIVSTDTVTPIILTEEEVRLGIEIESIIVKEILKLHDNFISTKH
ncbi:hypothetical protein LOTGIDRAFT_110784 [Lottia gigantea]|uniref:Phosphopantothenate--cysteine ligase n=1 Tax=Lottia gigantea TaxID=225164 RepID=V4CKW2_LOTGI|nr:hypothetical protein LOTGIDRAFT_110784 [Lottia gigantea]ESP02885.1 hypothetical protein LOTGIDRAFT_110784 [Lottia gigantea]